MTLPPTPRKNGRNWVHLPYWGTAAVAKHECPAALACIGSILMVRLDVLVA